MEIKQFKEGDVITRNEPVVYGHNGSKDSSYCGDRLVFLGHDSESKIIYFEYFGNVVDLSYAREAWNEGWCKYPTTLWEKAKNAVASKKP